MVGAAAGSFGLSDALREGAAAGCDAARAAGFEQPSGSFARSSEELTAVQPLWSVDDSKSKAFVDFQHDVTCEDVAVAAREGFRSAELLKRYTTLGMATDQGKTSSLNGQAIMAALTARDIPQLGTTAARPPYTPVAVARVRRNPPRQALQADASDGRLTPGHRSAARRSSRAAIGCARSGSLSPARRDWLKIVSREVQAVRSNVGVCDVSTLGKIDVQGKDAGGIPRPPVYQYFLDPAAG